MFKGGAGALDRRITIQVKVIPEPQDSKGGPIDDWDTLPGIETNAAFEPAGGSEFPMSQKRQAEAIGRFRIRYRSGIDPTKHRVKLIKDRRSKCPQVAYYNILSVTEVTRFRELHLEVSEVK